jgi:tRNA(adenine34) deaminase
MFTAHQHCIETRVSAPRPMTGDPDLSDAALAALMDAAIEQAWRARAGGEVPIGAVVWLDGAIVGRGFNQPISSGDPTAHAEIVAIRDAARQVGNYRLTGATVCVTIEPCLMCVGALVHARVERLVYGAVERRTGAVVSTVRGGELPGHNHRFDIVGGVREEVCRALMQDFFRERRANRSSHRA